MLLRRPDLISAAEHRSPTIYSSRHQHAQDGAEGERGFVGVPPAGVVIAPLGLAGGFHRAVVHIGTAGVGRQKAEGGFALPLAFDPDAVVFVEVEQEFNAVLRHVALREDGRVGVRHRRRADDAEVGPDGVGVTLGFFPAGDLREQPRQHPEKRGTGGRGEHGGRGRVGDGAGIAGAGGELLPPHGGGGGIGPAGGQIHVPSPDEPLQNERQLGLSRGADFQGGVVIADLGLDVGEPEALVAFAFRIIRLICHSLFIFLCLFVVVDFPGRPSAGKDPAHARKHRVWRLKLLKNAEFFDFTEVMRLAGKVVRLGHEVICRK